MEVIKINLDPKKNEDYARFMDLKRLPRYEVKGNTIFTDAISYNSVFGGDEWGVISVSNNMLFDYQQWTVNKALKQRRFAPFLDCGFGKTAIILHWADAIARKIGKVILLCPLQVLQEFMNDAKKFGIKSQITNLRETSGQWSEGIGILNYESMRDIDMSGVCGIALDESSILKNGDGQTKNWLCGLAKNIEYRLACSATPAPNEQAEYAGHAVFLGVCDTEKEFYSSFFRKDGTEWILKSHAVGPFYESLSTWACYIADPMALGFERGGYLDEEPEYIEVEISGGPETTTLFKATAGLADMREIERYRCLTDTPRFNYVVETAKKYKCIVWCTRNDEEANVHAAIEGSALITGKTPVEKRVEIINAFRNGEINCIVSKPDVLGWGVNLQQAEAHIVSGYDHSFEAFYQMIKRSHRFPREGRLKVFIPITESEWPIYEVIKKKLATFKRDVTELQKRFSLNQIEHQQAA
jgi:superfamily II DNA or RNA helicase